MSDETTAVQTTPDKAKLTKEERSQIAKDAAKRRWAKAKRAKSRNKAGKVVAKTAKHRPGPREFSSALKTAEKRLAKAITERAEAAAKYAVLSAEIPSLQRIIVALKNPMGGFDTVAFAAAAPSLEQIIGDQPITYQNPQRATPNLPPQPPMQHPAMTVGRAQGGAVEVPVGELENEDEDQFLKGSAVASGEWR